MNFSRGHSGTKFSVNRACFPKEKHQNSQWAKFMNFSFWPFLWFGLPGRLLRNFHKLFAELFPRSIKRIVMQIPDSPTLAFLLISLLFLFSDLPYFFLCVFPFFSTDFGVSAKENPCFFVGGGGFPCLFSKTARVGGSGIFHNNYSISAKISAKKTFPERRKLSEAPPP